MDETGRKRIVSKNVAVSLGIICILLVALIAYFTVTGISATSNYNNLQKKNEQLQVWLDGNESLVNQTQSENGILADHIANQNNMISQLETNITDLQSQIATANETVTPGYSIQYFSIYINYSYSNGNVVVNCGGYSRLSILISALANASIGTGNNATIVLVRIDWTASPGIVNFSSSEYLGFNQYNFTLSNGINSMHNPTPPYTTDVKAPYCTLAFAVVTPANVPPDFYVSFSGAIYLRNE